MVDYIEYKEKQYPIKVGYMTLKMLKIKTGKNLEEIGAGDFDVYETVLFWALTQGAKATGETMPFKEEDMAEILDDCFFDFVKKIPLFFPEETKKAMAMVQENGEK